MSELVAGVDYPADTKKLWRLACTVSANGDEEEFRRIWRVLELHADIGRPFLETVMGQSFERTGDFEQAAACYQRAVALIKNNGGPPHGVADPLPPMWVEYFARGA